MIDIPAWFDRKFDFAFRVDQYPNLCIRLRGTPARLEEIVRNIPRDVLIRTSSSSAKTSVERQWSAQEHAGHLLDLEPLWSARVDDFLRGGDTLTAADLTNRKTHEANHNARDVQDIAHDFRTARARLLDRVGALPSAAFAKTMVHPRLKQPMRLVDHLYFVAEHDDHHLAVIWQMTRS